MAVVKFSVEGAIDTIFPTEIKGNFEKRILWLKVLEEGKPKNFLQLTFENADGQILEKFKPGQDVLCHIEVKGFKWGQPPKENVFNVLKCTMIKHLH